MDILILGGGADQIALILELQKRGHNTILVDYLPNPPARGYVSKHIQESTLDMLAVERIALEERVDLICTACTDQALLTVAYVSEKLGLPTYISYATARDVTNKLYMKRKMAENLIPTARYETVKSVNQIEDLNWLRFPLVVKPADCNSSKGVRKVADSEELTQSVGDALSMSRSGTAIIEEFIPGIEISADLYVSNGKAVFLSATNSFKISNKDRFTILGSKYPAVDADTENQILQIAQKIATVFDLHDCPLLIQFIFDGKNLSVIEFSARMGGGSKYKLIEVLSGVNIMSEYVDLILGGTPDPIPEKKTSHALMFYVYCSPGTIEEFHNFDELKNGAVIQDYFLYKLPGATIDKVENSGDRAAGILITGQSEDEVMDKVKAANEKLQITDIDGNDIMLHNLI